MDIENRQRSFFLNELRGKIIDFGFELDEEYLEEINEVVSEEVFVESEKNPNKVWYAKQYLLNIAIGRERISINNFDVLLKNLGLEKEYGHLPSWFVDGFQLEIEAMVRKSEYRMGVSNIRGYNYISRNLGESGCPDDRELTCISRQRQTAYEMRKIFHPEEAETMKEKEIRNYYEEVEGGLNGSEAFAKWTTELKTLIESNFLNAQEEHNNKTVLNNN